MHEEAIKLGKFNRDVSTNLLHMVSDCCLMVAAFLLATVIAGRTLYESLELHGPICAVFMVIFLMANKNARAYNVTTFFYVDRTILTITKSFILSLVACGLLLSKTLKINFYFLVVPCSMWDLSSPTRYQTYTLCTASVEF